MKTALVPAALTVFAATVVTVGFIPDRPVRDPVRVDALDLLPATTSDARGLLTDAFRASGRMAFEGTLTVVGVEGPTVFQIDIAAGTDGSRTVDAGAWLFGRNEDSAWATSDEGERLNAGAVSTPEVDMDALLAKYTLSVEGARELPTGRAHVLALTERDTGVQREWLSVDDRTHLLVRRETFDNDGAAVRLVAFDTLRTSGDRAPERSTPARQPSPPGTWNGLEVAELPGRFVLRDITEHGEADVPTTTLFYSDGLYRLSIYAQEGDLDERALDGTVREPCGDAHVNRWPGVQPHRLVWSGHGHTWTAITDAPLDAVLPAISQFPCDPDDGVLTRMRRGLERVADTLWPFD